MVRDSVAYQYVQWCLFEDNHKVGEYIKKQATLWKVIADGVDDDAIVDEAAFEKIYKLLGLIIHPDLQQPLNQCMERYAWFLIVAVLCTKKRDEPTTRYYTTALLEIARKNFKTFYSAVIFILLLLTEPQFSRFFSVAPDLKLSSELKIAIRKIIKASPALADESIFRILRGEVRCKLTDSEYTPLAYSEDKMDGKLAQAFLADEAGAMDSYPIEAMRSSQITLKSKLGIIISTQYPNDGNGMIDEIDRAKKTLDGLMEDKRYFALLYEPDSRYMMGDLWMTEDLIIYQANPVAVDYEYIFDSLKEARALAVLYENKRENFLCKHCNIKYKGLGVEGYVDVTRVRECKTEEDLNFWKGKSVYLGLDLSQTDDNTAVAMVTYVDGIIYAKAWGFVPGEKVDYKASREKVNYRRMIGKEYCYSCGEEVIDYGEIERFILGLQEKYGVIVEQVGYDRYNAISTVQKLEGDEKTPLTCVEIRQHSSVLHPATKLLKECILSKTFRYDENELLEINFQNARCTEDTNLNKYVNKKKSGGKVDMVVAMINALYLLNVNVILMQDKNWGAQVI